MTRVIVTGADGFVGSHLTEYLAKNGKNSLNNIERLIKLFGGTSAL